MYRFKIAVVTLFSTLICGIAESSSLEEIFDPKPLDGVQINAIETYVNPRPKEVVFGVGLYPLNEYFNGFSASVAYNHYFSNTAVWEIANVNYIYSVDTDITSQLADDYGVNPESIERLELIVSTNYGYMPAYGKIVLLKEHIEYFRVVAFGGLGALITSKETYIAPNIGLRLDFQISPQKSVKVDIRDHIAIGDEIEQHVGITVATGISF